MSNHVSNGAPTLREELSTFFGSYRAEWLGERLFELFTAPDYLPELTTARPCFLIGGRGTGKTTVLRGLSYEGQRALAGPDAPLSSWKYFGFYYRVNTNRIAAFQGAELPPEGWIRAFSHFVNLGLCEEVTRFLQWLQPLAGQLTPPSTEALGLVGEALHLGVVDSIDAIAAATKKARVRFEAYINNVADGAPPPLSLLGQPVDLLCEALKATPFFQDKLLFFLVDEYENLADYQQQIFNTLIKHSGTLYTFKVGIKDLGLRRKTTLNEHEQLISPADYERIEITARLRDTTFSSFARTICNDRLQRIAATSQQVPDILETLPGMTEAEEAIALGIEGHLRELRAELRAETSDEELRELDAMAPLEAYLVMFWSRSQGRRLGEVLREALANRGAWTRRLQNYQHALLFTLRRRKRGIHKYYCGWDVFTRLASGNIRYLLHLVSESLLCHVERGRELASPVSFDDQTLAAQEVGRKNLTELEGLAVNGAQLTRLVLGLGRIFQVMAHQAEGHAPEINQFYLGDADYSLEPSERSVRGESPRSAEILSSAVMHQALVRSPGNKLPASSGDTKDYDYSCHPIFAAFFEFSYRRKRHMRLAEAELIGLVEEPRKTIAAILARTERDASEGLGEQLSIFSSYFDGTP